MKSIRTRFILIEPSHAGNVGAVARALRTMGFDELVLVRPRWANVLRRQETIQRASGALDVLAKTRVVDTLDEAIDGLHHLCATAMVGRDFGPPTLAPRAHMAALVDVIQAVNIAKTIAENVHLTGDKPFPAPLDKPSSADEAITPPALDAPFGVGFLFGSERFGMANEDVYRCHAALQIPTAADFGSLNLAAAVQLIAYEWRQAIGWGHAHAHAINPSQTTVAPSDSALNATSDAASAIVLADMQAVSGMLSHLEQALVAVDFLDPAAPKKLMPRLTQLFYRAKLRVEEIHILRGMAKAMLAQAARLQASVATAPAIPHPNLTPNVTPKITAKTTEVVSDLPTR